MKRERFNYNNGKSLCIYNFLEANNTKSMKLFMRSTTFHRELD
jgi:hypothetical protein